MSRKTKPDIEAQAVILREAGYSCPAIAAQLDLSLSTTKRILKRRGAVAGAATEALIEQARQNMLNAAFDLETVQGQAAALTLEDIALARLIREKTVETLEALDPSTSTPYQMMRTTVAAATALDLTQKVSRRALPLERLAEATHVEQLSELRIRIMTDEDVRVMREQQRRESAERITGNPLLNERSPEDDEVVELVHE
ncbi:helix-turn-helix domain-containing protein [Ectopseudomonas guguanensis]|uniref:helix-turn-helix domain-containing protein n=1 Tax=Ectopseudomonas guguanensis TaxID=1198456 RepID=UPI0028AA9D16|nr:helix-turn-helix domain-containing protein [Pseudomonas guguanensis]